MVRLEEGGPGQLAGFGHIQGNGFLNFELIQGLEFEFKGEFEFG
jgi:hypothetical protein